MNDTTTKAKDAGGDDWAAAMAEQGQVAARGPEAGKTKPKPEVQRSKLQDLQAETGARSGVEASLDVILDIPVTLSMEIGRTTISIRNLLQLNQGSVVELDRLAGEPMDVLVNGCLVAHGEVVVVNEKFGIRLTDVISAAERVKKLK